ncbi:MAG: tRNA(His) guanylyltransferase Thg1 family protein [Methanogenium sp.]|jgi:tRNA(His) 5'-end guanylyltransferase
MKNTTKAKISINTRMKTYYENQTKFFLLRRTPVIIRLDGKCFHSLTKNCEKPFDENFRKAMVSTSLKLCESIQNVKLAYSASDEISLLLVDYNNLDTCQWFDGEIQKIVSISASIAGVEFTKIFGKEGHFDSRTFNIPREEVCNYFIARQQDAIRNSIQAVAQSQFSHKTLHKLNTKQLREKLLKEKQVDWNDIPEYYKKGFALYYKTNDEDVKLSNWIIDIQIPKFNEEREYVERFI